MSAARYRTDLAGLKQHALHHGLRGFNAGCAAFMQRLIEAADYEAHECNDYTVNPSPLPWGLGAVRISHTAAHLSREQIEHDESGCDQKAKNTDFWNHGFSLNDL
ncbi:hypothetical protein ACEN2T_00500 [Pseudomonas sp. W22_MBD1_FP4]|jgi:hypothetical protein|uniref:hypothetical protein n=1 Tax=Pseudomonas TaxID=286 RepID=UPI0021A991BE|nr:hypothetical protein [Pseudomonas sivasensis]MCT4498782.1 hypothetical protein [Pseudomonas sivasensis]